MRRNANSSTAAELVSSHCTSSIATMIGSRSLSLPEGDEYAVATARWSGSGFLGLREEERHLEGAPLRSWKHRQDLIDNGGNEVGDRSEGELRLDLRRPGHRTR